MHNQPVTLLSRQLARLCLELRHLSKHRCHDVFTHGSFGLRCTLLDQTGVSGVLDWGLAGVADRYVDLASAVRSIASGLGPELIPTFFQAYGLERPDPRKLDFYALLAEFE